MPSGVDVVEKASTPPKKITKKGSGADDDDEGVEVVLEGKHAVVQADQNVFRNYRGMPPPPHHYPLYGASGSWGYPPPPPHPHHAHPYPPPPYSGSFEDYHYPPPPPPPHYPHTVHYSPHVPYPPPGPHYPSSGTTKPNVISPHHKVTPSPKGGSGARYQYPPTSPVSRPSSSGKEPPTVVTSSFDSKSAPHTPKSSNTPSSYHPPPSSHHLLHHTPPPPAPLPPHHDPHMQFYGSGSWGSFDSHLPPENYYGGSVGFPPDSPYSPYYGGYPPPPPHPHEMGPPPLPPSFSYEDERLALQDYHPDQDGQRSSRSKTPVMANTASSSMSNNRKNRHPHPHLASSSEELPEAASEVDFDIVDPPLTPVVEESTEPVCESPADVNPHDVLLGRGGGTNSQVGNRAFRTLVQDFQPTYLRAKRKEKPLLARTIVLIIRKRGGRFLKKNEETGELYEVGDAKAEAKTSQALREGLDVRATKAAEKLTKKKKKQQSSSSSSSPSHLSLPQLDVPPHPPSPNPTLRKRRRGISEKFAHDFLPPRADLAMKQHEEHDDDGILEDVPTTPLRRNHSYDCTGVGGCASIAMDIVTGAATGSFCLGPSGWRR